MGAHYSPPLHWVQTASPTCRPRSPRVDLSAGVGGWGGVGVNRHTYPSSSGETSDVTPRLPWSLDTAHSVGIPIIISLFKYPLSWAFDLDLLSLSGVIPSLPRLPFNTTSL